MQVSNIKYVIISIKKCYIIISVINLTMDDQNKNEYKH